MFLHFERDLIGSAIRNVGGTPVLPTEAADRWATTGLCACHAVAERLDVGLHRLGERNVGRPLGRLEAVTAADEWAPVWQLLGEVVAAASQDRARHRSRATGWVENI